MKITSDQLPKHLKSWFYIVSGDEPLLVQESCDVIRKHAKQQDYSEKKRFHIDNKFNWDLLFAEFQNQSLFSDKKLIELYLPSGKPGTTGAKMLQQVISSPPEDTLILCITGKLDLATQKTKWFSVLEKAGVFVPIFPVDQNHLPDWLHKRLQQHGLTTDSQALQFIAQSVEGNLLAAAQEIEKLALQYGEGTLSFLQVKDAITDNSRFNVFELVDGILQGGTERITHILNKLKHEAVEPIVVLWALTREIRTLAKMAHAITKGQSEEQCLQSFRVWNNRKALVSKGLKRHSVANWQRLLQHANQIDAVIKGQAKGNIWDELLKLSLFMAGIALFRNKAA